MKGIKKERLAPKEGNKYEKNWKGVTYTMVVVKRDGLLLYKVNNEYFKTPSGAAKFVTINEVNGWSFWKI